MSRPDAPTPATVTTEQKYIQRMADYEANNSNQENGVIRFFDEISHLTHTIDLSKDADEKMDITFETCATIIGKPHNYGPTREEKMAEAAKLSERANAIKQEKADLKKRHEQQTFTERQQRCNEWLAELDDLRRQKHQQILDGTLPTQDYLTKCVLPSVLEGLMAVIRARPEDPVDFLGEFLLQLKNPKRVIPPLTVDQKLMRLAKH